MTEGTGPGKRRFFLWLSSPWSKIAFALVAIGALVAFNRMDLDTFVALKETWGWLIVAFGLMLPPYVIVSYRFYLVMRNQGVHCDFPLAARWTMIGSFFDLLMPSNSGGDIVKAGYVLSHVGPGLKTQCVMAIGFDRVLGLIGLFLLAAFSCGIGSAVVSSLPGGWNLATVIMLLAICPLVVFRVLGSRRVRSSVMLSYILGRLPGGQRLLLMISCFSSLREERWALCRVLGLSVLNHVFWCAALFCVVLAFQKSVGIVEGFIIFPLAIFSNVFGFAGGFGVGTVAFDVIFAKLVDIQIGASIGLTFQTLSAVSRLSGLPYFLSGGSK